jgi:hypothetical protein
VNPGAILRCRNRDWVLLLSNPDLFLLRLLAGATEEVWAIYRGVRNPVGYTLPEERFKPSSLPPPSIQDVSHAASAHLLWQAARFALREDAFPLGSLGRISIWPSAVD